jgi:hypothetical protein
MRVVVSVSDKYLWALHVFAHFFNKYWSPYQEVVVAGYTPPEFKLPDNFTFFSIDKPQYPKERWADGFLKFLNSSDDSDIVLMLEDYWLCRNVDLNAAQSLSAFIDTDRDNILRVDLSADRLYAGGMRDIGYYYKYDIIEAPNSPYQMSLQTGLWNKRLLKNVLDMLPIDKRSAWDVELEGTNIVNNVMTNYRIYGTRQLPIRYVNGMNNSTGSQINYAGFTEDDRMIAKQLVKEVKNDA